MKKVGHAGTLDPIAEGLLVVALGKATKLLEYVVSDTKEYIATLELGKESTTYDAEGELTMVSEIIPSKEEIQKVLQSFQGTSMQQPPIFSALKVDGKRAYALAREGKDVELPMREVHISQIELIEYTYPNVVFRASVSSGTYIRSLIHDIGKNLQTGAYMTKLVRTKVGNWALDQAITIEQLEEQKKEAVKKPHASWFHLPECEVRNDECERLMQGKVLERNCPEGEVQFTLNEVVVGIGKSDGAGIIKPRKILYELAEC